MNIRTDILWRVYLVYAIMLLFSGAVLWQLCKIQLKDGAKWRALAKSGSTKKIEVEAIRGNILSDDGSLLATSLPQYELHLDGLVLARDSEDFNDHIDSLGIKLSRLFSDKTADQYVTEIKHVCQNHERYYLFKRNVSFTDLKVLKAFPLFDQGHLKSGLIALQLNKRIKPFGNLAYRTIGYYTEKVKPVGLEGAYRESLIGKSGESVVEKVAGGIWVPVHDEPEITPIDGDDIVSTINVNIQDVAQNALMKAMIENKAEHGSVIVMEVHSGEIKAMANLTRTTSGTYEERFNYAIGESTEPGSTFKLATYLVGLESHKIDTNTLVDTHDGAMILHNHMVRDAHSGLGIITAKKAFEESSNVAAASLITQAYGNNPKTFMEALVALGLNKRVGLPISGEAWPRIKNPESKDWSALSLQQIAYGYEIKLTPLQMLTLYNAVANQGIKVVPLLVKEIDRSGKPLQKFSTKVSIPSICSSSTLSKIKKMLEGVILQGTGTDLKKKAYSVAGKTGTAQIAQGASGYLVEGGKKYQASFCGYFPADHPEYSIMVVINDPSSGKYYASAVAEPVFGEIADRIYSTRLDLHPNFAVIKESDKIQ